MLSTKTTDKQNRVPLTSTPITSTRLPHVTSTRILTHISSEAPQNH